ncbi:diaminopimelate decarboxylase [Lacibacterium aquatile]|uniref:Diaminopimelate decarboxylase n=1 Tax=Lacibacterium aquatile TaxID=1168082 RepID=A0ABW5DZY5_9PROT
MMTGIEYRGGILAVDGVPLPRIADAFGTPTYVYSTEAMVSAYRGFASAFADRDNLICYALKANSNLAVISTLAAEGAGADAVSIGEIRRALAAGVEPKKIVFAGVGKTAEEMAAALEIGILQFNVESLSELKMLSEVATALGHTAEIAVRVNPDVDAKTHAKITTGKKGNKFGIDLDQAASVYALAKSLPGIKATAIGMHIGSQILDPTPFEEALRRLVTLTRELRDAGHDIQRLDCGGGLGIPYKGETPVSVESYAQLVKRATDGSGCKLIFEPGRYFVGNAGVLITKVVHVKDGSAHRFIILDSAMNDLVRPAMYDAWHTIVPVKEPAADAPIEPVEIVGPICESSDQFAKGRPMPPLQAGDLVAILSAGAYSRVMSSNYNTRPEPPEVLVKEGVFAMIKPRPAVTDLFANETLPEWLVDTGASPRPRVYGTR